jgi:hypothetical protein
MALEFQGRDYSYADISFSFMGATDIGGVTAISYKIKRNSENIMGAGAEPIGYTLGTKEYEGSMTVTLGTWMEMCKANDVATLTDAPAFNIVLGLSDGTEAMDTIEIGYVRITEDGFDGSSGDSTLPVELPFIFARLKRG